MDFGFSSVALWVTRPPIRVRTLESSKKEQGQRNVSVTVALARRRQDKGS